MNRENPKLKTNQQTLKTYQGRSGQQPVPQQRSFRSASLKTEMAKIAMREQQQEQQTVEGDAADKSVDMTSQAIHKVESTAKSAHQRMIRQAQASQQKQTQQQRRKYRQPQNHVRYEEPAKHKSKPPLRTQTSSASSRPNVAGRQVQQFQREQVAAKSKTVEPLKSQNPVQRPTAQTRMRTEGAKRAKQTTQARQKSRGKSASLPTSNVTAKSTAQPRSSAEAARNPVLKPTAQARMRSEGAKRAKKSAQARQRKRGRTTKSYDSTSQPIKPLEQVGERHTRRNAASVENRPATPPKFPTQAQARMRSAAAKKARANAKQRIRVEYDIDSTASAAKEAEGVSATPLRHIGNVMPSASSVTTSSAHAVEQTATNIPATAAPEQAMKKASTAKATVKASAEQSARIKTASQADLKTANAIPTKAKQQLQTKTAAQTVKRGGQAAVKETAAAQFKVRSQRAMAAKASAAKQTIKKRTIAAIKAAVQAAAKGIKSMAGAIAGAGAGVLAPLIVIVLLGALLCGPLGLFFTGDADNEMTLQQAMTQLNTEFSDRISEIENSVPHDEVKQEGHRAIWKDILTVYAVKATTDKDISLDVVTMDEAHLEVLRTIFWDMNAIEYDTETYTEIETTEVEGEDGETETQVQTVEKTRLIITIFGKTAVDMAAEYNFTPEQISLIAELLSDDYTEFWSMMAVPGVGSNDIVEVALSQVGNVGGQPYWSWYGFPYRVAWCACFVSWCADQCGYLDAGIVPRHSLVDDGIYWFQVRGQWQDRYYLPSPGDIIYFDWQPNGYADHVGIVESCDGFYVYTIEGNSGDACRQLCYAVGSSCIYGYGVPDYLS